MAPKRRGNHSGGFLLIIGLPVLAALLMFTSVGLERSMTELTAVNRAVASAQAFQLAEAGVDDAIQAYTGSAQGNLGAQGYTCAGTTCTKSTTTFPGVARLNITVTTSSNMATILSTGTTGTLTRQIKVVGITQPPGFGWGMFGGQYLRVGSASAGGPMRIDSFDGTLGAYGGSNVDANGNVGTNGDRPEPDQDLVLEATFANIQGNISTTASAHSPFKIASGSCGSPGGCVVSSTPIAPFRLPTSIQTPSSLKNISCTGATNLTIASGETQTIPTGCYNVVTIQGTGNILANSAVSMQSLVVQNNGTLTTEPGVRLYLRGTGNPKQGILSVTGNGMVQTSYNNKIFGETGRFWVDSMNGFVNATKQASDLIIRVEGNGTRLAPGVDGTDGSGTTSPGSPIIYADGTPTNTPNGLRQAAPFYGALYLQTGFTWVKGAFCGSAPPATPPCNGFTFTGATFYGSVISGGYLNPSSHSAGTNTWNFHFDESLANTPLVDGTVFNILSWQDCGAGNGCS